MFELSVVTNLLTQGAIRISILAPVPKVDLDLSSEQLALENTPSFIKIIPTPKPRPIIIKTAPEPPAEVDSFLHRYAGEFNLNADKLHRIANCESHYNPGSVSGSGAYGGMFQFSASTWISTRKAMQLDPNPDLRFNAEEAIRTAAWKIAHGGISAWPVCGLR